MGRKKKKASKPWCWYCNREFDDDKILVQHQKAKHFKCHICHKKLYTGPGLSIHCMQVHKETIDKVPNALPNRSNIDIEIFGMEGIPANDLKEHERLKNGGKSESDDEEPAAKKKVDVPITTQATMLMPGLMHPQLMGQFPPMPPFGPMGYSLPQNMAPGGIPMYPHMMARQMFPGAMPPGQPKPTFPAYSNATISAPPTTNNSNSTGTNNLAAASSSSNTGADGSSKTQTISTTSSTSKICHPPDDLSLEEIRAKHPKYQKMVSSRSPKRNIEVSTAERNSNMSNVVTSTASAISQAQEVAAIAAAAQANVNAQLHAAVHQQHQKQLEELNRAMIQRLARQQAGPPIGMVPVPSHVNLMQPLMRGPAMAITPQALLGGNMMRPGPPTLGGLPAGLIAAPLQGMVAPGMGVMLQGLPAGHVLQMMPPRFR